MFVEKTTGSVPVAKRSYGLSSGKKNHRDECVSKFINNVGKHPTITGAQHIKVIMITNRNDSRQ